MDSLQDAPAFKVLDDGVMSPHAELISSLKGQVLRVPDLLDVFPSWPSGGRNKYYKRLKAGFDEIIQVLVSEAGRQGEANRPQRVPG